jgi:hypothetical protein
LESKLLGWVYAGVSTLLNDIQLDPRDRLAGSLLLLYSQPLTRVVKLATRDVRDEQESSGSGSPGASFELPEPLSDLALEVRQRAGASQWLFPGRHPGRHLSSDHLGSD